jgi:hypothetical protein
MSLSGSFWFHANVHVVVGIKITELGFRPPSEEVFKCGAVLDEKILPPCGLDDSNTKRDAYSNSRRKE